MFGLFGKVGGNTIRDGSQTRNELIVFAADGACYRDDEVVMELGLLESEKFGWCFLQPAKGTPVYEWDGDGMPTERGVAYVIGREPESADAIPQIIYWLSEVIVSHAKGGHTRQQRNEKVQKFALQVSAGIVVALLMFFSFVLVPIMRVPVDEVQSAPARQQAGPPEQPSGVIVAPTPMPTIQLMPTEAPTR